MKLGEDGFGEFLTASHGFRYFLGVFVFFFFAPFLATGDPRVLEKSGMASWLDDLQGGEKWPFFRPELEKN